MRVTVQVDCPHCGKEITIVGVVRQGRFIPGDGPLVTIDKLGLSTRVYNLLQRRRVAIDSSLAVYREATVLSVEALCAWSGEELEALRGSGPVAIAEIREALERRGLYLKGEGPGGDSRGR